MEKSNFEMRRTSGKKVRTQASFEVRAALESGSEVETSCIELHYSKPERTVEGLVKKKIRDNNHPEWAKMQLDHVLSQWRYIRDVNNRRRQEGKTTFTLPGTVRGYHEGNEHGIIETDLTENGKYDLKDLKMWTNFPTMELLQDTYWQRIREQILRDVQIAEEEHISLAGGPYPLDPWLVVNRSGEPIAYLVDIGGYTAVRVSDDNAARSTAKLRQEIEKVDALVQQSRKEWNVR